MSKPNEIIHILIADDHPVTRIGIRFILEEAPDIKVVGEAKDGVEATQMVAELHPDVLLLDLGIPGLQLCEIEKWVSINYPETATLVLAGQVRDCYLAKAIEAGAVGFLTKEVTPQRLMEAIRRVARGDLLINGRQLARANRWHKEVGERWKSLTKRERRVLQLLTQGLDNITIAGTLCVTTKTVECHVTKILRKLDVSSRQEAIVWINHHLPEDLRNVSNATQGNP